MRLTLLVVAFAFPAAAFACVGIPCADPWEVAAGDGGTLPSNVPAFLLSDNVGRYLTIDAADSGIAVTRADGGSVAFAVTATSRRVELEPLDPLVPGETIQVTYPMMCNLSYLPFDPRVRYVGTIHIGEPAPLPTSIGELKVVATGHRDIGTTCDLPVDSAYATLKLTPSPELVPYLPVTSWRTLIDGQVWATERAGAIHADGTLEPLRQGFSQYQIWPRALEVSHKCPIATVTPPKVVLEATIAGVETPLTIEVTASWACDGAQTIVRDGGTSAPDAGPDVAPPDGGPGVATPPYAWQGCMTTPGGAFALALGLLALRLGRKSFTALR